MRQKIVIDFETYYDPSKEVGYGLKSLSMLEYVRDPRFKAHGLGFMWLDPSDPLEVRPSWVTGKSIPKWVASIDWSQVDIIGHNVKFDGFILREKYGVRPRSWVDTKGMSRAVFGKRLKDHSLATIAQHFGFVPKGVMKTAGIVDLTPDQERELAEYCLHDVELTAQIFWKMEPEFPANQYPILHWTVQTFVEPKLLLDVDLLKKTEKDEIESKAKKFAALGIDRKTFSSNNKFAELLKSKGYDVPMKESPKKKNPDGSPMLIPAFALGDTEFLDMLESENDELRTLCEARVAAKSNIIRTRSARLARLGETGLWSFDVEYSGANQTHRFSGGSGAGGNPQNFNRCQDPVEHKSGHTCDGVLRSSVVALPGYKLVVGDFAAVECRLVAYLSGDPGLIAALQGDPYCEFASVFYGRKITKADDAERRFGKEAILGLGYGMGYKKFKARVKIRTGQEITDEESERAVELYRTQYAEVPRLWNMLNRSIGLLVSGGQGPLGSLPVRYEYEALVLPSGLKMQYPNLRQEEGEKGVEWVYDAWGKKKAAPERSKLYGGKMLENISQGLAGELCKEALAAFGADATGQVHDELHVLAKKGMEQMVAKRLEFAMSKSPSWLPSLKLKAEVGVGDNWFSAK